MKKKQTPNSKMCLAFEKSNVNGIVIVYIRIQTLTVRLRWISIWPHNLMEYNLLDESFYCAPTTNHPGKETNNNKKNENQRTHQINDGFNGSNIKTKKSIEKIREKKTLFN